MSCAMSVTCSNAWLMANDADAGAFGPARQQQLDGFGARILQAKQRGGLAAIG